MGVKTYTQKRDDEASEMRQRKQRREGEERAIELRSRAQER